MTTPTTLNEIMKAVRSLPEGDRVRILKFTLGILESRRGKREQRAKRFKNVGNCSGS